MPAISMEKYLKLDNRLQRNWSSLNHSSHASNRRVSFDLSKAMRLMCNRDPTFVSMLSLAMHFLRQHSLSVKNIQAVLGYLPLVSLCCQEFSSFFRRDFPTWNHLFVMLNVSGNFQCFRLVNSINMRCTKLTKLIV